MFTGLVSDVGVIEAVSTGRDAKRFEIRSSYPAASIALGASIAHAGCCLTVIEVDESADGSVFAVEVSHASLEATTLGTWETGGRVNLERSLKAGDEMGGHLVTGHVDGVGEVVARDAVAGSIAFAFAAPEALARFIAAKGSITVDGVSLTVNAVEENRFTVNIIPHTGEVTTLGALTPGDRVNLEVDLIARYLARLTDARTG